MNIFNRFIDNIKDTYITVAKNKNSFIKPAVVILIVRAIQIICAIFIGIFFINLFLKDFYLDYSKYSFEASDIIKYFVLLLFSILFFLLLQTITIIVESFAAIYIVDEFEITFEEIKDCILENFFKIYGGLIVIGIISTILIGIAYLLLLVLIIPIAVLTFGIGIIFINTYIYSSFAYWKLLAIRYEISPFEALGKNINLGFNNIIILVLFNLVLVSFTSILGTIIGFLAIPVMLILGLILKILLNIFTLKLIESK